MLHVVDHADDPVGAERLGLFHHASEGQAPTLAQLSSTHICSKLNPYMPVLAADEAVGAPPALRTYWSPGWPGRATAAGDGSGRGAPYQPHCITA